MAVADGDPLPKVTFANYVKPGENADIATLAGRMGSLLDPAMCWRDVDWLRGLWKGPFLLKGVLHPAEASESVARGADGVIVSNHGGRRLDGAPATVEALAAIAEAIDGHIPILIDGGLRRGADVVKAIALGATACLIARTHLRGLSLAGEAGVVQVLEILRHEIDRTLGQLGATTLSQLKPHDMLRRS